MAFVSKWLILLSEIPFMDALTLGIFCGEMIDSIGLSGFFAARPERLVRFRQGGSVTGRSAAVWRGLYSIIFLLRRYSGQGKGSRG